jgi:hypothetical protein
LSQGAELRVARMLTRSENSVAEYWVEDGFLFGRFLEGAIVDLDQAKDCVRTRNLVLGHQVLPLLLDVRGLRRLSKHARDYLGSAECMAGTSAGVLLTDNSLLVRTIANTFFALGRPTIPHRMFADRDRALEWLAQYKMTVSDG